MRDAEGSCERSALMREKAVRFAVLVSLSASVFFMLWITLFSRLDTDSRHFFPPFWSYRAIINGSGKALYEVVGNIILFIPIGVIAGLVLHLRLWQTVLVSFALSLTIESCQWFFWLGSFEIDDLLHNTLGAVIGTVLTEKTRIGRLSSFHNRKKNGLVLASLITLITLISFGYQGIKNQTMVRYAAMNDREDGTKNLLVLSPDPKYIGETDFNVSFNSDGSIVIEGKAVNRAWIEIGKITLPAAHYSFSGLSGMAEKTVAIELEYFNTKQNKYMRLTQDVGPVDAVDFKLKDKTKLRVLIGLYAGAEGEYLVHPVIYKED